MVPRTWSTTTARSSSRRSPSAGYHLTVDLTDKALEFIRDAKASFERDGDSMPAEGTLTLHVGEREVGRGRIRTQPGKFSIAGEGLNIGKDGGEPVTDDYPGQAPWAFTGGTIHRAAVDVSGEPFVDLAAEARMAFMRD